MVAISMDSGVEAVVRWASEHVVSMPIVHDPTGAVARAYGVTATPTVFVVGPDGALRGRAVGRRAWTGDAGRAYLMDFTARRP